MQKRFFYLIAILSIFIFESCKPASKIQKPAVENVMIHALRWQEANPIFSQDPKDWTNGAYYTGVARAHRSTNDKEYLDVLIAMGKRNSWQPYEKFFHADDLVICYPYVYLKSIGISDVDLAATEKVIKDHLYKPHAWKDGPFEKEQVILWWWCDALFMAPPLITFYSMLEKNTAYLEDMYKYYKQTYDLLYDKEAKLFARDNRFLWTGREGDLKEKNGNKIFWSRGNGWVFAGLALLLEDLPKDYVHRAFFENLFKEMANKIKDIQPKDGLWRTSLLSPESFDHGEASGTGFFTFALAWGINNGLLDKAAFKPSVVNAWAALKKCQHEDGKVGWVQNIGADPRPAGFDSWQNFGTGAFLLAGSEVLKMK